MPSSPLHGPILAWYAQHARDLPWRRPGTTPWAVLVSEVMLQQTPVTRVLAPYDEWLRRWPTPSALAADEPAAAVRAWGRLGYPRRALRLHAAAVEITTRRGGVVPSSYDDLRALPGVGDYTASAVASFAYGARRAVLDTNVRRVLARAVSGSEQPVPTVTATERRVADALVPAGRDAARWAIATMELGALICTSRSPACERCPVLTLCAWQRAGCPAYTGRRRPTQAYDGTDRQARGRILAVLRDTDAPAPETALTAAVPEAAQRARALRSLVADRLICAAPNGTGYLLGGSPPSKGAPPKRAAGRPRT